MDPAAGTAGGEADSGSGVRLSVVLACPAGGPGAEGALRALRRGTRGVDTEVLLAHPPGHSPPDPAGGRLPVRSVQGPPDALVPHLWGAGCLAARGAAVAFTTTQLRVGEGWARLLLDALHSGAAGAGGPIRLAPGGGIQERAVHLLRYSGFSGDRPAGPVDEVPGDNAAYRREALSREEDLLEQGFWDVEVHRRLRERGEELVWVPDAVARLEEALRLRSFLAQRFRHGRRFGRYRAGDLGVPVWRILAAGPLVPAVLALRSLARFSRGGGRLVEALPALPVLLVMASAWAAGEAWGAVRDPDASRSRIEDRDAPPTGGG